MTTSISAVLQGGATNPVSSALTAAGVTIADSNTASTVYPVFVTAVGTTVPLYIDSVTTPLSYVPSTSTLTASVFTGVSNSAKYADLAEVYETDSPYDPGTVVVFGGEKEITTTNIFADVSVAGVVSTAPAYLMNKDAVGLPIALRGRVPVKVLGVVKKGDLLVTSNIPGVAESIGRDDTYGIAVFAKAIEDSFDVNVKVITAVIL